MVLLTIRSLSKVLAGSQVFACLNVVNVVLLILGPVQGLGRSLNALDLHFGDVVFADSFAACAEFGNARVLLFAF